MTDEKKKVPELRFPEFSGEWEEKKLGDVSNRVRRKNKALQSTMPLTISAHHGLVDQRVYFGRSVSSKNLENYTLIYQDEFAYNKSYSNELPYGAIKRLEKYSKGALSTLYICFKFNKIDSTFMKYYFETTHWYHEIYKIAVEGARNHGLLNISVNDFFDIKINTSPSKNEQQKIGEFFSKLDRQIELEEQKLEKLEELKKGYIQKIFSQELRFKDENGNDYPEWRKQRIGNIATTFSGGTPKSSNKNFYNGKIPFIRSGEISKQSTELTINEQAIFHSSAKMVEAGDLLYALYGATSGEVAISKINGAINQAVLCIRSQEVIGYLYSYLKIKKDKILRTYIQGGQGNLSASIIKNLDINLPSIEEQEKIAGFFSNLDKLIEKQNQKMNVLKLRKRSFLQKLII
ncbi:restriction endonuclease subunit S [uncultured Staphylococcus sp.]|uniref:restriction endonuclease subunit S n=1 Tax=uncultured Staphylococcus sp. TaxID=189668 RepID=UPI0025E893C2|nr:restriction endonuclease subunit S [uncultured Staphylococcus sp.]